jgi:parallel beta-helix repeat protein
MPARCTDTTVLQSVVWIAVLSSIILEVFVNQYQRRLSVRNAVAFLILLSAMTVAPLQAQLSGNYTIGGTSPDYNNFTQAAAALAAGVSGPVVFNVRPGTYTEQITLPQIAGASSANTITFQSENGLASTVILTNASTVTTANFTVLFNGADWVRFRNITLRATGTTFGIVVRFGTTNASTDNLFEGCVIEGVNVASTSLDHSLVHCYQTPVSHNNNTFRGNTFINGAKGLLLYGSGTNRHNNMVAENNIMQNQGEAGIYLWNIDNPSMMRNTITTSTTSTVTQYGLYLNTLYTGFLIEKNRIALLGPSGAKRGIQFWNSSIAPSGHIKNNFVTVNGGASTSHAFYISTSGGKLIYNNTFVCIGTAASSRGAFIVIPRVQGLELINNIIVNHGNGQAYYTQGVTTTAPIFAQDYNVYYGPNPATAMWWNAVAQPDINAFRTASQMDANSIFKDVTFVSETTGDLHLGGPSQNDTDLTGAFLTAVPDDIDDDDRTVPYRGADEACYTKPEWYSYSLEDANGLPPSYIQAPGVVNVRYSINNPIEAATITITLKFFSVTNNQLVDTQVFQVDKQYGQTLDGIYPVNIPSTLPPGYYRIEIFFNLLNSCAIYVDRKAFPDRGILVVAPGQTPCVVWPGDVNNDGVVNYLDRKELNRYIYDAKLSTLWLNGPARYVAEAVSDPLAYVAWTPQAAAPWYTPRGCYMDSDGNGVVNNLDYIAIKLNWMRVHGGMNGKQSGDFNPATFDISQNYPNPFNPTTTLRYSLPERSHVQISITDLLGRVIETPVNGTVDAGVYTLTFDANSLPSGQYIATVNMLGQESGLGFTKSIRMTLSK